MPLHGLSAIPDSCQPPLHVDSHLPIPGATSPSLTRTNYEAGNAAGNPVIFDNPGDASISVKRVITPRNSAGTEGEPLAGGWAPDNIP